MLDAELKETFEGKHGTFTENFPATSSNRQGFRLQLQGSVQVRALLPDLQKMTCEKSGV